MKSMSNVYKAFDVSAKALDSIPAKKKNDNPISKQLPKATSHVDDKVSGASKTNIKAAKPAPDIKPGTASSALSASTGTTAKPATPVKFKPPFSTPFTPQVQIDFYDSLSKAAKDLVRDNKLTKEEAAAVHAYTKDKYYHNMNGALRTVNADGKLDVTDPDALMAAGINDAELATMIASAVKGLKKLPPAQTSNDHFNSLGRNDSIPEEFLKPFQEGESVTVPSFFSTTVSPTVVNEWWDMKDQTLCIFQRVNGNGRDITAFSEFPKEREILFIPGTQFTVLARTGPTETPSGNPSASFTKTKVLMQLQEVSADTPVPPTITPSTFNNPSIDQ